MRELTTTLIELIAAESIENAKMECNMYNSLVDSNSLMLEIESSIMMNSLEFENDTAKFLFINLVKNKISSLDNSFYRIIYPLVEFN